MRLASTQQFIITITEYNSLEKGICPLNSLKGKEKKKMCLLGIVVVGYTYKKSLNNQMNILLLKF